MTSVPLLSITIKRSGFIVEIEGTGASVTFYPYDKDRTFEAIIEKCKELGDDLTLVSKDHKDYSEIITERHNIDIQLTEIYKEYYDNLEKRQIRDEDQLLILANSQIKCRFIDQIGRFYAVIQKEECKQVIVNMDHEEFDRFLIKTFYDAEKRIIGKDKRNNAKMLLEAYTTERRTLYDRIAKVGEAIYYDLNNEHGQCVKITKEGEGWDIIDNPLLFRRISDDREQLLPDRNYDKKRHYVREIIEDSTIKHQHQKLIDEVYTISLFIPDIAHPMAVPIGPRGSGKTMHLRIKKLIVDPRDMFDALVEKLPRDDRDRRVAIYDNCISFYDNETMLSYEQMDELCMWVTGFSKTIRILNTTDERRTYSGKRILGINGINIPVSNSDILNRCFISEFNTIPDGMDGKDSKIISENEYLAKIKDEIPQILGYIFDILGKTLQKYDEVASEVKSNHRLADFVIWCETIARVLGYANGVFLEAWKLNTETQNLAVIQNNSFAILVIKYVLNKRPEKEFSIEPGDLLKELKAYAPEIGIDYYDDKQLPKNAVWLARRLNMIKSDLRIAGIIIDSTKSDERLIWIKKDDAKIKQEQESHTKTAVLDLNNSVEENDIKEFALNRFKEFLKREETDKTEQHDFQMDLTSSAKFYVGDALQMIETLVKEGLLIKDEEGFLSLPSV